MGESSYSFDTFVKKYVESFERYGQANFMSFRPIPSMVDIEIIVEEFMELLFPGRSGRHVYTQKEVRDLISELAQRVAKNLLRQIYLAYYHENPLGLLDEEVEPYQELARTTVEKLFDSLSSLRNMMREDAQSALDGDPAATSVRETIICYPGVRAITLHRIAHFLYQQRVPLVPRMFSEIVHRQTGIDIHPGATIGRHFFIDHGTGVVIGETTIIGDRVKLYQGVTLGALSFPKDACGSLVRGTKRHPTLENSVTVYANATVLGDIVIGENSIIGSSTWIRESVLPNTLVQNSEPSQVTRDLSSTSRKSN